MFKDILYIYLLWKINKLIYKKKIIYYKGSWIKIIWFKSNASVNNNDNDNNNDDNINNNNNNNDNFLGIRGNISALLNDINNKRKKKYIVL